MNIPWNGSKFQGGKDLSFDLDHDSGRGQVELTNKTVEGKKYK